MRNRLLFTLSTLWMLALTAGAATTNLALKATASTSFVSGWESLAAVNDGYAPSSSTDRSHAVYGNWNGDADYGKYNWVQYEWSFDHSLSSVKVYWFTDYGGLAQPNAAYVEYWDGAAWVKAGNIGTALNAYNTLNMNDVMSSKVRLYMKSTTSTGIVELQVMGVETTECKPTEINPAVRLGGGKLDNSNSLQAMAGDSVELCAMVQLAIDEAPGRWTWTGPLGATSQSDRLRLKDLTRAHTGTYMASYRNACGITTTQLFYLSVEDATQGQAYTWPAYSPTINYNFRNEYPNLQEPVKDLQDCTVAGSISDGWWTFRWGSNANKLVTEAAVKPMLQRMNTDFAYFRDVMGWPPDKRAKSGYRSAIYLYGSGLTTDNASNTDLGGWQSAIDYNGQSWPMVLISYYPVYCYDPKCTYSDKAYQTGGVVHEGIHSVLADLPGCKKAAWFHEGGNTWLQQEADSRRSNDYSSMGFLNGAPFIAPFMPIECYSGWLQDDSFGGPSAEGVNMFNGSQQICTWRNYLGGTQYGNGFAVFLGQTLGDGSIPWIWRYCEERVLEGIADTLGDMQTRRLITEYRAKQALLDMDKWTNALKNLVNDNFNVAIKSEWTPSWMNPTTWYSTPYAKTTNDGQGLLTPEYRTTPGWTGANQIPLHITGDKVVVHFRPLSPNMTCQLCYRTQSGEKVYGEPVTGGDCVLDITKKPANNVVFAVITSTDYIYLGEETRKAHYDYRLQLKEGIAHTASTNLKWFNWNTVIKDPVLSVEEIENTLPDSSVYPNVVKNGGEIHVELGSQLAQSIQLYITNLGGAVVYQRPLEGDTTFQLPQTLGQGVYLLSLSTSEGNKAYRLIVE